MSQKINYLFAEDQTLFRKSLITLLKEHKLNCIGEAANGLELLELLKTKKPDLILLDIEMPMMDGSQAFDLIRSRYPEAKVILLSIHHNAKVKECFFKRGAKAFLSKNKDDKEVVEILRAVHEDRYKWDFKKDLHELDQEQRTDHGSTLHFTRRELEVLSLVYKGLSNKEISNELNVVLKTVEAHKKRLYSKTKVTNLTQFIKFIDDNGLTYLR